MTTTSTPTTTPPPNIFPEALRPFLGPAVAVTPPGVFVALPWAQEIRRRYEAARQSLMVQQIVIGVGFSKTLETDRRIAQTALTIRGWDQTRWSVANVTNGDWDTPSGRLVDARGQSVHQIEFHCGTLGVAEAVRVTLITYGLVAGLGLDELSVQVVL